MKWRKSLRGSEGVQYFGNIFNFVIYVVLLLCLCIIIVCLCIFVVMYDLLFVYFASL